MANQMNDLYRKLVTAVHMDNMREQTTFLSVIETQRNIPVSYLINRGCLLIPNNEYIHHYLGKEADSYGCDFYYGETCTWTMFVTIPIENLAGEVVGLVGWDMLNKYKEVTENLLGLPMYRVSGKNIFARDKYFLTDVDLLKRKFDTRVVFVTDGVFDSIALNYRGIPAIALLGSTFSPEVLYFLRWYKRIFVCADNDKAGYTLYNRLKFAVPGVSCVIQDKTKDIEELLRGEGLDGPLTRRLLNTVESPERGDLCLFDNDYSGGLPE